LFSAAPHKWVCEMDVGRFALWLLVLGLGLQTSAGLFETRVLVPLWSSAPPASVIAYNAQPLRPDSGRRFWILLTPTVGLICLVNLVLAWLSRGPARAWWLTAAATGVVVVAATFAYFVPALLWLVRAEEHPAGQVVAKVRWWVRLNWIRVVALVLAWLAALRALSLSA
jgi:Domain of unknown function (DUF1772)